MWSCSSEKFCCGVCWLGHSCGAQSMGCVGVPGVVCPDCFCFVSSSLFFLRVMGSCVCFLFCNGEFDSGSGRTLAACLTHASRTMKPSLLGGLVANG